MMSHRLCGALAIEFLLLLPALAWLSGDRALTPAVALAACAAIPIVSAGLVIAAYAVMRRYAASLPPAADTGRRRTWRCAVSEQLALFVVFVLIQPFERWWLGPETSGRMPAGRVPVLLVHGYLCNRGMWWWLRRRLRARQYTVATVNLEPPLAGLDELAARLGERVDALLAQTGAGKVVLVTHSMGALVARAYLQAGGATRVASLVTLAAPHHGTRIARLGCGRNARQMQPGSEWLRRLNERPSPPVPIATIWSVDDEILAPPDTARLPQAREIVLSGLGHLAMVFSPTVLARLEAELAPY
jgi:triacylglycerol lipase